MAIPEFYQLSRTQEPPVFDSLPVAKITDYPLEPKDYKPFAQSILCVGGDRLFLRMWAFEVSPMAGSALEAALYLFPERPDTALSFRLEHGSGDVVAVSVNLLENGAAKELDASRKKALSDTVECVPHNGEDLQGIYWGMTVSVPLSTLELLGGVAALKSGDAFPGNFYKLCAGERFAHQGSCFPADFPGGKPYGADSMGRIQVLAY